MIKRLLAIGALGALLIFTFTGVSEPPDISAPEPTLLGGEPIEFPEEVWVLGFVILPGCPACEQVITWFGRVAQTLPQMNIALVVRADTPNLTSFVKEHAAGTRVLLDSDGALGARHGVTSEPTVFLFMEGEQIDRLDWPFTEQDLLSALAELLEVPDPAQLLGQIFPEFTAIDLTGREVALAELPRPLLLSFFNPYCHLCWTTLPSLAEVSQEVAVVIFVSVFEGRLAGEYQARFERFLDGVGDRPVQILLLEGFHPFTRYVVERIPYILIDEQGMIVWTQEGLADQQDLRDQLRAMAIEPKED